MAVIIPYGDTQAHGSIGDALSFRRWRGRVVMEKKPHPRQPDTAPQLVHREKFRQGWIAYHTLDAEMLDYYRRRALQLNMTAANLFLREWLTDEIPSNEPLNEIWKITDLSLPKPISPFMYGTSFTIFAFFDDPEVVISLGIIWDKENIPTLENEAIDYDRALIEIAKTDPLPTSIPFDYPIVIKWQNIDEEDKINLVRLPEITFPTDDPAYSTTHMNLIKEITGLNLVPIAPVDYQFVITFNWHKETGPESGIMGYIEDKKNAFFFPSIAPAHDKFFIEILGNNSPPQSIPENYPVFGDCVDFEENGIPISLLLPAFQLDDGGAPSSTPILNMKSIDNLKIIHPVGERMYNVVFMFKIHLPPEVDIPLAHINDNENVYYPGYEIQPNIGVLCAVDVNYPHPVEFQRNYLIAVWWTDTSDNQHFNWFLLPYWLQEEYVQRRFFISDDWSLYNDADLTDLVIPARKNTKKLWVARDWSLYWDEELTQLAKGGLGSKKKLWLAKDFSVYWDREMTQLANAPFA